MASSPPGGSGARRGKAGEGSGGQAFQPGTARLQIPAAAPFGGLRILAVSAMKVTRTEDDHLGRSLQAACSGRAPRNRREIGHVLDFGLLVVVQPGITAFAGASGRRGPRQGTRAWSGA